MPASKLLSASRKPTAAIKLSQALTISHIAFDILVRNGFARNTLFLLTMLPRHALNSDSSEVWSNERLAVFSCTNAFSEILTRSQTGGS